MTEQITANPVIVTDAYGSIPKHDWQRFRKLNVSPLDYAEVAHHFGSREFTNIRKFIEAHSLDGSYVAPWPFPKGHAHE
jgi:hypothetical protein